MNDTGENTMEGRTNIDDFLTVRGFGGGYGGYMGGGYGPSAGIGASYAGLGSIQHGIECNRDIYQSGNQTVLTGIENLERANSFNRLCDKLSDQNTVIGQNMLQLTRDQNDARAEAAKCCCDIKVQAANDKAELKADIKELEVSRLKDELSKARDANNISETVERTLAAMKNCGCCGGGHHG